MIKKIIIILVVLLVVVGCFRDPKPGNTLKREKFISVLTDMHIGEAMYLENNRINLDSIQSKSVYLSVLKKYNVSEKVMLETTLYYSRHPREFDKIYTEVISRMQSMNEEVKGIKQTPEKK